MAVLVTNDNETGSLASYSATQGTPTIVAPPAATAYTGNFVLAVDMTTDAVAEHARETWTNGVNAYVRVALRVDVVTNPTTTVILQCISLHDSTFSNDNGAIWLRITNAGIPGLQLKNLGSTDIGSVFTLAENTWYIVELKNLSNGASGTLEMRVDGVVQATSSPLDVGTAVGMIRLGANAGTITGAAIIYFDVLEVWDNAYPGLPSTAQTILVTDLLGVGDVRSIPA